jgi:hypothetical protein
VPVVHPGAAVLLREGQGEHAHHLDPQRIGHLIVRANSLSVVRHLGSLLSIIRKPKYTAVITFRIGS